MTHLRGAMIIPCRGFYPTIEPGVFVAPGATVIGDVTIGAGSSVWYGSVLRGDVHHIRIGEMTNIQDGTIIHVTHDAHPTVVGNGVTVGHRVILHGCTVHDHCLIGMGSTVLDGAVVETRAMVAAGALVTPGTVVPTGTLFGGLPARKLRSLTETEMADFTASAERYHGYAVQSAADLSQESSS